MDKLKLVPSQELKSVVQEYKHKLWQHIEKRKEYQYNQKYIQFLESNIEELTIELKLRKVA